MKLQLYILFIILFTTVVVSDIIKIKQKLKSNRITQYKLSPKEVDSLTDMFTDGIFYGRFRSNTFVYDNKDNTQDYTISGFGGSMIYKSGYLNGFGFTTGFYTTQNLLKRGNSKLNNYHSGKDTFSRYNMATRGESSIESLAQAFIEYRYNRSRIRFGRQFFESFLTKSNDTKMIPNSFEGITFHTIDVPSTKIKMAFLTKQKLRDHSKFHHILAYGDNPNDDYAKWSENDDGAMHRGLTLSKLQSKGIDDELIVIDI
ncbi:MAG: OprD family outer membrane porin, partial [Sulfurovaceae bacterium]|nr:OprD family outer membrane porin [Sulfurovaceae bacterium]